MFRAIKKSRFEVETLLQVKYNMNAFGNEEQRYEELRKRLLRAVEEQERAIELEELAKKHIQVNNDLKVKLANALEKNIDDQVITQQEWDEMDQLTSQQGNYYKKMVDKLLRNDE
ncbi:MAG: hypothetical protein CL840_18440 [Crocinitomicaceae bacterium]|nr:hypothetical protein [Crocinitomicaceae bacterium]